MYDTEVPRLSAGMRSDPEIFARGVTFAILSIQQQFITLPRSMADVSATGDASKYLFGSKRAAYRALETNKVELWRDVCALPDTGDALHRIIQSPGIGLAKGAFVLQMLGHDVACMDSRNLAREGLSDDAFNLHGRKVGPTVDRQLQTYLDVAGGRSRELWDVWCHEVAEVYHLSPDRVSEMHCDLILPP